MASATDISYLRECVGLARDAFEAGDAPFGSLLVNTKTDKILVRDRNRTVTGSSPLLPDSPTGPDATLHPEFTIARWAALNLSSEERANCVVYTSGEHCAMCSAAHTYVGLGKIVYATSSVQLGQWMDEMGVNETRALNPLRIQDVAPGIEVVGPVEELADDMRAIHYQRWKSQGKTT